MTAVPITWSLGISIIDYRFDYGDTDRQGWLSS